MIQEEHCEVVEIMKKGCNDMIELHGSGLSLEERCLQPLMMLGISQTSQSLNKDHEDPCMTGTYSAQRHLYKDEMGMLL